MLLLLAGATSASKECRLKDIERRLPWAPGWSFKLKDLTSPSPQTGSVTEASRCSLHHWQAPNVVEVNLFNNSIGDEGCIALADALAAPSSALRTLYLERNAIGDRGTASARPSIATPLSRPSVFLAMR